MKDLSSQAFSLLLYIHSGFRLLKVIQQTELEVASGSSHPGSAFHLLRALLWKPTPSPIFVLAMLLLTEPSHSCHSPADSEELTDKWGT